MFAGFQPGTQVGLGVGRPGARVGAGRPGARRWIMPPTIDRNHLDTMDPATYALVRDMLTRQYLAAHGPALMAPPLSPVVAPRGRAHAPAPRGPVVIIQRQATPWRTAREERASWKLTDASKEPLAPVGDATRGAHERWRGLGRPRARPDARRGGRRVQTLARSPSARRATAPRGGEPARAAAVEDPVGVQAHDGPPEASHGRGRRVRRLFGRADGRQAQALRALGPLRGVFAARRRVPRLSRADRGAAGDCVIISVLSLSRLTTGFARRSGGTAARSAPPNPPRKPRRR